MARNVIPKVTASRAGVNMPTEQNGDATNGHVTPNSGRTIIVVRNADSSSHSVTFVIPGTVDGSAVADRVESIPATTTQVFGGFSRGVYSAALAVDVDSSQLKLLVIEP